jgi:hypothetical protein
LPRERLRPSHDALVAALDYDGHFLHINQLVGELTGMVHLPVV